jgi:TolB-like protein/DNA-binding winged helix-turn-helix (wHTH) protein/tetratricopeptide (TPR) repeat protein
MPTRPACVVRFGVFELDIDSGELRRHGLKVRLPEQSFQILKLLLSRPGDIVTREELQQVVWTSDTFVDFEVGLNSAMRKLREALDDSAENPRFVETLPRRGYRFVASVAPVAPVVTGLVPIAPVVTVAPNATPPAEPASVVSSVAATARPRLGVWILAALMLASVVAASDVVYRRSRLSQRLGAIASEPVQSLVVLPFENLTGDVTQAYFVDAVTDALTTHLAQVEGLDVISRTSARQYQPPLKPLIAIGKELNVDAVVEGSLVRSGSRVRLTAQLIKASTDRHIWAQTYDGESGDMLALQQQIASDIAEAAGWPSSPNATTRMRRAVDPQAYEAYVKGLTSRGLAYESNRTAVAYFDDAIARQPDFAHAHAELAVAQFQFLFSGPLSPREVIPKAEAAARKALELDPTLARAHWIMGQILSTFHWKWDAADEAHIRAYQLRTGTSKPSTSRASLSRTGRSAEAIALAERARTLDPLSLNAQIEVGNAYQAAGQHDRALEEFRRTFEMSPGNGRAHFYIGATFAIMGRPDEAIPELETAVRQSQGARSRYEGYLAHTFAMAGRTADAERLLKVLESRRREQYVSSFVIALVYDALGDTESALAALERARDDRAVEFAQMAQYPPFKAIAAEARFQNVMRYVGLPR